MNRKEFEISAEVLGKANKIFINKFGDFTKNIKAKHFLEYILTLMHGSYDFYDNNISVDTSLNYNEENNLIGLGILNTKIIQENVYSKSWPNSGFWSPANYSNGSTEGVNILGYNTWGGYIPSIIDPSYGTYTTRVTSDFPLRFISPDTYERVPYWEMSRLVSLYDNDMLSYTNPPDCVIQFDIPNDFFVGCKTKDATSDFPIDFCIYSNINFVQTYNNGWDSPTVSPSGTYDRVNFKISKNGNDWRIRAVLPDGYSWPSDNWLHLVFMMGSEDDYALDDTYLSLYTPEPTGSVTLVDNVDTLIWYKRNFFYNLISNNIQYLDAASTTACSFDTITSSDRKIKALQRTHYINYDGQYNDLLDVEIYNLPVDFPAHTNGFSGSLAGYINEIKDNNVVPILLCLKTIANTESSQFVFVVGPEVSPEFFVSDWNNFEYFPDVPENYFVVSKIILKKANDSTYALPVFKNNFDINNTNLFFDLAIENKIDIVWFSTEINTYSYTPVQDVFLLRRMIPSLYKFYNKFIGITLQDNLLSAAFHILVRKLGLGTNLINNVYDMQDEDFKISQLFSGFLKTPVSRLLGEENTDALYFSSNGRSIIKYLINREPSTEFLVFSSDGLYLTDEILDTSSVFEIYYKPDSQCDENVLFSSVGGDRLNLDYTLRMRLIDQNENCFIKDWFIMASKYFVSQQEYNELDNKSGYFTYNNLDNIEEWRKYQYSGLVPDLYMGKFVPMYMRYVSPPDSSKQTESEYRQSLVDSGYNEQQVNELVLQYLENGGVFYEVDTRRFFNKFNYIDEASISAASYSYGVDSFWKVNLTNDINTSIADSFTVSVGGLDIGTLEETNSNSVILQNTGTQDTTAGYLNFSPDKIAAKIKLSDFGVLNNRNILNIKFITKIELENTNTTGNLYNTDGFLKCSIYSDYNNEPNVLLATSENECLYSYIESADTEINFTFLFEAGYNESLWVVLEKNGIPLGGNILVKSDVNENIILVNKYKNIFSSADKYYSSVTAFVTASDISYTFVVSSNTLTLSGDLTSFNLFTGQRFLFNVKNSIANGIYNYAGNNIAQRSLDFSQDSDIKSGYLIEVNNPNYNYVYKLNNVNNPVMNLSIINFVLFSSNNWLYDDLFNKILWLQIKISEDIPILCTFNRDDYITREFLPPVNDKRTTGLSYKVDGYWAWTIMPLDYRQHIYLYPRVIWHSPSMNILPPPKTINVDVATTSIGDIAISGYDFSTNTLSLSAELIQVDNYYLLDKVEQDNIRILIKDFVGAGSIYNGVYQYINSLALTRADDTNYPWKMPAGMVVNISYGTINGGTSYSLDDDVFDFSTTFINFSSYSDLWAYAPTSRDMNIYIKMEKSGNVYEDIKFVQAGTNTPVCLSDSVSGGINKVLYFSVASSDDNASVKVATTTAGVSSDILFLDFEDNIITTSLPVTSVDGIAISVGDRILIKDLIDKRYNGIYDYITSSDLNKTLQRSIDFDSTGDVINGMVVRVRDGSVENKNKRFACSISSTFNLNINDIEFNLTTEPDPLSVLDFNIPNSDNFVIRSE